MSNSIEPGHWDFDPGIVHHFSDGVYAKQAKLPAGSEVLQHKHSYSHLSILAAGRVIVSAEGQEDTEYVGPACIEIRAGVHHSIRAIEDSVWFCIHATDETDPDKVDEVLISK